MSTLFLFSYSLLAGIVEGILYSKKGSDAFRWNEHAIFVMKMGSVGLLYCWPAFVSIACGWMGIDAPIETDVEKISIALMWAGCHPLIHDGAYYETRRRIDVPNYRWYYDYSKTSTARLEIRFIGRLFFASAGVITYITLNVLL